MEELYEKFKALLFTIAYQMTGSIIEAEDAVQDVFVKLANVDYEHLSEPKAYLCKMVVNRCYDYLKSAKVRREQYIGPWLPEPIPTTENDIASLVIRNDLLSYAMLVLLERLTPTERTVFVLREALSFRYSDIAKVVDKSESNCRKILSRAREKMEITEDEAIQSNPIEVEWVQAFLAALQIGNVETMISLLAEDVILLSDGGGKVMAALHPIKSRSLVSRFLLGILKNASTFEDDVQFEITQLNGQTGVIVRSNKEILTVALLHIENDLVKTIYLMRNPDKLSALK